MQLFSVSTERERLEDAIWFAEDLRYNNGEVLHLIDLTKSMTDANEVFEIATFENVSNEFEDLMKYEEEVNGNILHTDCYYNAFDRIEFRSGWYKRSGFLELVRKRATNNDLTIQQFLIQEQKQFVRMYETYQEIYKERDTAKQLYICYILSTNYISGEPVGWNWNGHYNFGKLEEQGDAVSLFEEGPIFQFYRTAFRENETKILQIHRFPPQFAFELLHRWALN